MPLRLRLSLWYGSALALILVAFSTVLYFVTARSLRDALDQSLEETAAAAVRSLEERGFLPLIDEDELMTQFPELARIDKFFQIFSPSRSEEHTSELQSHVNLVCRLLLEKKKQKSINNIL